MKKLLLWITGLFNKAVKKYTELMEKAKPLLATTVPAVLNVVNMLKDAVENPLTKFVISSTGTKLDDQIAAKLAVILPKVLIELKLFQISVDSKSNQEILNAVIDYLRSIDKENRAGKYTEIAAYTIKALADSKLSIAEIIQIVTMGYINNVNLQPAA